MKATLLRVERRTYDGGLVAYWDARLLRRRSRLLIWHAGPPSHVVYPRRGFNAPLRHQELGWVWLDRHYTVTVELSSRGDLERALARVCLPPTLAGPVVSVVELGLDLVVTPGPEVTVDEDEFHERANDLGYPPQLRARAWTALEEARRLLEQGAGPFGPDLATLHALALKTARAAT